jgi:hypothetical protein
MGLYNTFASTTLCETARAHRVIGRSPMYAATTFTLGRRVPHVNGS